MAVRDSHSYLDYVNKLVDEYNNITIILSVSNLFLLNILLCLNRLCQIIKLLKFKVGNRVRITTYKHFFSKGYSKNWSRKIFVIDSALKTNPRTYKIKDSNGKKILCCFYEKELLRSKL